MLIRIVCLYNIHQLLSLEITCITIINKVTTLYCVSIRSILVKKLLYIINNGYSEIICAKYDGSIMNDAHTNYPADIVSLPAKVIWLTAFFLKKKAIFVWLLCWPLASQHGSHLMKCE